MASSDSLLAVNMFIISLLLVFLLFKKKQLNRQIHANKLPPAPPRLPIIGNLHQLGALPHVSLWQLSKKYGPVMFLKLGAVPTVIISSAEAAKEVLKTHDLSTCSRPASTGSGRLTYNYLDVVFTPYGDYWKDMKRIYALEIFNAKRVQSFRFIRDEEVALLIDSIGRSSASVNLSEMFLSLTANITCRLAFGKSFRERGLSNCRSQEVIHEAMAFVGRFSASNFFPYTGQVVDKLTGFNERLERSFKELDRFYQKIIDDHIVTGTNEQCQQDIVDVLLNFSQTQTETDSSTLTHGPLTHEHIKAILMDIFLGGTYTSATTLTWAMTELTRNPRAMTKAQNEIRKVFAKTKKVTEHDIDQLEYFKMVVKETLRLHPPLTLLLRETTSDININGYHINPKTCIFINVWGIARDPKTWNNPEEFFPDRFMDSMIDFRGQHYEFLPFGSGRRACPGISLALATVELALANLLFWFDWKLPDNMKAEDINMEEVATIATYKKVSLLLTPVKRQPFITA